ncbi:hypothetical protein CEXT_618681 [Caerostris extrusa]|uniref:Uncharacterized protein n=1 Tax=Caerostris extrusa TaxID=172846 RepID=A0AAV4WZP4_CAEEX|nr:hypothetical protein CEXT_618681 [Caerostris extrusa]
MEVLVFTPRNSNKVYTFTSFQKGQPPKSAIPSPLRARGRKGGSGRWDQREGRPRRGCFDSGVDYSLSSKPSPLAGGT